MAARRPSDSPNWGGARPESGPKAKYDNPIVVGVPLPKTVVDRIEELAAAAGVKRTEFIRGILASDKRLATAFKKAEL